MGGSLQLGAAVGCSMAAAAATIDYFAAGQYLSNGIGIENPTSSYTPIHDDTAQWYGLAKVTGIVDENTRLSFIGGGASARFQIPNNLDQVPNFTVFGNSDLEQLDPRPAPVGEHLFRHRLAAEDLRGLSTCSSRASRAIPSSPTSPTRSAT